MQWKSLLVGVVMGALVGGCCHSLHPSSINMSSGQTTYWRSTVRVQVNNVGNTTKLIASGFPIDKETIITAGHFCMGAILGQIVGSLEEDVRVISLNNNDEVALVAKAEIISVDEKLDICVLKAPGHGVVPLELVGDYEKDVKVHDEVSIVGAPMGFFPVHTNGRVVTLKTEGFPFTNLNDRIIISVPGTNGNSGGPILTKDGKVIGIVMAKLRSYDHIILGVHADMLKGYLKIEHGK